MDAKVMDAVTLVMLAVGLAMDAFAVSICKGLSTKKLQSPTAYVMKTFTAKKR